MKLSLLHDPGIKLDKRDDIVQSVMRVTAAGCAELVLLANEIR